MKGIVVRAREVHPDLELHIRRLRQCERDLQLAAGCIRGRGEVLVAAVVRPFDGLAARGRRIADHRKGREAALADQGLKFHNQGTAALRGRMARQQERCNQRANSDECTHCIFSLHEPGFMVFYKCPNDQPTRTIRPAQRLNRKSTGNTCLNGPIESATAQHTHRAILTVPHGRSTAQRRQKTDMSASTSDLYASPVLTGVDTDSLASCKPSAAGNKHAQAYGLHSRISAAAPRGDGVSKKFQMTSCSHRLAACRLERAAF
jgi:hypothetical protein